MAQELTKCRNTYPVNAFYKSFSPLQRGCLAWVDWQLIASRPLGHAEQECSNSLPWLDLRARLGMTRDSA